MHFLSASIFENPWYSIFPHKGNILLLMIFTLSFESKSFKLKLSCTDIRMSSCVRIQFSFVGENPLWNLRYLRRILRINIQVPKVVYISYGKSFNYIFIHYSPIQNTGWIGSNDLTREYNRESCCLWWFVTAVKMPILSVRQLKKEVIVSWFN